MCVRRDMLDGDSGAVCVLGGTCWMVIVVLCVLGACG